MKNLFKPIYLIMAIYCLYQLDLEAQEPKQYIKQEQIPKQNTSKIIVTAKPHLGNAEYYKENQSQVPIETIKNSGARSLQDILQNTSDVVVGVDYRGTLDIRGQGEDKSRQTTSVLVDGIHMNVLDVFHYWPGYNMLPSQAIDHIDIFPGSGSVIFGSGTQSGSINIKTSFTSTRFSPVTFLSLGKASFKTQNITAYVGNTFDNDRLLLQFGSSYDTSEAYLRGEYSKIRYYSFYTKYKVTDNQTIGFMYSDYSEDGQYAGVMQEADLIKDWRASSNLYPRDRKNKVHNLIYQGFFNNFFIEEQLYDQEGSWLKRELKNYKTKTTVNTSFAYHMRGHKLKVKYNYGSFFSNNDSYLLIGNDWLYNNEHIVVTATNQYDYNKETLAFFALNKIFVTPSVYLITGFRYNKDFWEKNSPSASSGALSKIYKSYYNTINSTAYELLLGRQIQDKITLYVKRETGFTSPDGMYVTDQIATVYYPNKVQNETFATNEVGTKVYIPQTNTSIKVAAFDTTTNNELSRLYTKNLDDKRTSLALNLRRTNRKGVEFFVDQKFFNKINILFSGTYAYNKTLDFDFTQLYAKKDILGEEKIKEEITNYNKQTGKWLAKVPKWNLLFRYKVNLTDKLSVNNSYKYISEYIGRKNNNPDADEKEYYYVKGYVVSDLDFTYNADNWSFVFGIKNLFNRKYYTSFTGVKYGTLTVGMERNYYVTFRYEL